MRSWMPVRRRSRPFPISRYHAPLTRLMMIGDRLTGTVGYNVQTVTDTEHHLPRSRVVRSPVRKVSRRKLLRRKYHHTDRLRDADANHAAYLAWHHRCGAHEGMRGSCHCLGRRGQAPGQVGRDQPICRAREQYDTQGLFETIKVRPHCRLRQPELPRGGGEASCFQHGQKDALVIPGCPCSLQFPRGAANPPDTVRRQRR
jgi:hypothetical protein